MNANADEYARRISELTETLEETGEADERAMAAEHERRTLISQALRNHIGNMTAELRRYEAECDHINAVCDDRTSPPVHIERSP